MLPQGYYKAQITDMYVGLKPDRVVIKATVAEGPFTGTLRTDGIGVPRSEDDKVRHYWRALAESVGFGSADLDNGQVTLSASVFVNRVGHMYFVPKDEENGVQYEKITWLAPAEWTQQKANFDMQSGAAAAAPAPAVAGLGSALGGNPAPAIATPAIAAPKGLGGNNTTSKSALNHDLLNRLRMPS